MGLTQEATSFVTLQGAVVSMGSSWTLWGKGSVSAVKQSRTKLQGADFAGLGFQNSLLLSCFFSSTSFSHVFPVGRGGGGNKLHSGKGSFHTCEPVTIGMTIHQVWRGGAHL